MSRSVVPGCLPPPRKDGGYAFSLTEMTIVLTVAGLILAGIWVAAGSLHKGAKVQLAADSIQLIVDNMHAFSMGTSNMGVFGTTTPGTNITTAAFNADLFPRNVLTAGALPAINPWGGTISLYMGTTAQSFRISMDRIPPDECIRFFSRFLDQTDLVQVNINGTWRRYDWILNNSASASCPGSGSSRTATLEFTFRPQRP